MAIVNKIKHKGFTATKYHESIKQHVDVGREIVRHSKDRPVSMR